MKGLKSSDPQAGNGMNRENGIFSLQLCCVTQLPCYCELFQLYEVNGSVLRPAAGQKASPSLCSSLHTPAMEQALMADHR